LGYKKYTKASVSGEGIRWCYAEAFGISEDKIKATGFPRTDVFFDEKCLQKITFINYCLLHCLGCWFVGADAHIRPHCIIKRVDVGIDPYNAQIKL